jgi:outer membrane scaffolding protein for murein synthesis (MipA/OmpV family)
MMLGLQGGLAMAQAGAAPALEPAGSVMRPLWEVGVGIAGLRLPDYRGADESSNWLLPLPYIVYRGEWLKADRDGARAVLVDTAAVELDLSVSASAPTRGKDNAARAGMPDLKPALEIGPNLNVELHRSDKRRVKLDLCLPLRVALSVERSPRFIGTIFSPTLNLDVVAGEWKVGLLSGPVFGDRRYHDRVYGVDAAYATPQRGSYRASGGYSGWQSLASVSRRFDRVWVGAFLRHDALRGAAFAGSPLLRRTDAWTMGVGMSWIFTTSSELVAAEE